MSKSTDIVDLLGPTRLAQRVADQALSVIPAAEGVLIGFSDGNEVTYVTGSGYLVPHIGTTVDLHRSRSGLALRTRQVMRSDDTEDDPDVDLETCRRLGVRSAVWVPLCRGDEALGVLAVTAGRPHAFSDDDVALLSQLADFMSIAVGLAEDLACVGRDLLRLGQPVELVGDDGSADSELDHVGRFMVNVFRPDAASRLEGRQRTEHVLEHPELLTILFQPIVRVGTRAVVGVEALARFAAPPARTPDLWFDDAHRCGLGIELECLAVAKALDQQDAIPKDWFMTCNVGPETMLSPTFAELLAGADQERVVLELTEHTKVADYPALTHTLHELRQSGARLAIDDTGSGFSSLSHILRLGPDFIKLDRELVSGIDFDPVRRVLTSSLVDFAAGTGAEIIAEGVEIEDELRTLELLGVRYAQGYFTGPAADIDSLVHSALVRPRDIAARRRMGVGVG